MKIKLLVARSGLSGAFNAGEILDVDEAEGVRLIQACQAAPVVEKKQPERAVKKENSEKRKHKKA